MTIRWTEAAADSIERLHHYIESQSNEDVASEVVNALVRSVEMLAQHPQMGRCGFENGTRELARPPYVIVYKIVEDAVNILNVVHGAQRF